MSDNKQQTAVEWLYFEINRRGPKENNPPQWLIELYEQAKEMFEEQMIDFANAYSAQDQYKISAKYYYKENYGGNNE